MGEKFKAMLKDFKVFSAKFLKIKNKKSDIIDFTFNGPQNRVHDIFEATRNAGKLLRFIILKARQEGVSTYFEGRIFHRTATAHNRKAVIIGHEIASANNLFDMTKRFYANLPNPIKPSVSHSNEKKLAFDRLGSEIIIGSADAGAALKRSDTIQDLHCTEVAFWRDAKSSLNALLQTVPDEKSTMIVLESTANGIGGEFYDRWQDAKSGKSDYIPIFLAWFDLAEYTTPFTNDEEKTAFAKSITDDEIDLANLHHLTLGQLNWRRKTIENKCGGDIDLFRQEYPSNDKEAFIATGRPVFNANICYKNYENAKEPIRTGYLEFTDSKRDAVKFVDNRRGFIKIFKPIEFEKSDENIFAAGCDVAEGLEQGDFNTIRVLDRRTMEVVLTWTGHIDPDLFAIEQKKIQLYLSNKVYFCTEKNNHGLTTIVGAAKLGVRQYYDSNFQTGYEVETGNLGFKTTSASKPIVINILNEAIRDGIFKDYEKEFWGEALTFVRNAHGQMQAQNKDKDASTRCYDDRVIAEALMMRCHNWMPKHYSPKEDKTPLWAREIAKKQNAGWQPGGR